METTIPKLVITGCIASSFMVVGNAITNTYMAIPAILTDFPAASAPEYSSAVQHIGRMWPRFNHAGHVFFRPIGTLSFLGYSLRAFHAYKSPTGKFGDWRLFAVAATMHLLIMLHSNFNMGQLNRQLSAYGGADQAAKVAEEGCVALIQKWAWWNMVRVVLPAVAGTCALLGCL